MRFQCLDDISYFRMSNFFVGVRYFVENDKKKDKKIIEKRINVNKKTNEFRKKIEKAFPNLHKNERGREIGRVAIEMAK